MTVNVSKPVVNVREKLAELDKPTGIAGEAMLRAETPQEQFNLIGAGRRRINHNGAMQISQRGTTFNDAQNNAYTIDRYKFEDYTMDQLVYNVQQVADGPTGFANSLKVTIATVETAMEASEFFSLVHVIEAQDMIQFGWGSSNPEPMSISFWVKSSVTGTYSFSLYSQDGNRAYGDTYSINSGNTWEYKTFYIPPDNVGFNDDNGGGLWFYINLAAGPDRVSTDNTSWGTYAGGKLCYGQETQLAKTSGATWQITGFQVEKGSVATPFEHRSYGEELALCQRYYWQTESYRGGEYSYDQIGQGFVRTTNTDDSPITIQAPFPVPMRVRPAVGPSTVDGAVNFTAQVGNTGTTIDTIVGTWQSGVRMAWLDFDLVSNPFSVGQAVSVYCNGGSYTDIQFDAEL